MSICTWSFLLVVFIPLLSAKTTKKLQVQLTCKGELSLYDRRISKLVVSSNPANYTLHPENPVLYVRCRNRESQPWIMGRVSNGMVTDTRWKCFSCPKDDILNRAFWAQYKFDDSRWAQAVAKFSIGEVSPRGKVPGISEDAFWISTADKDDTRLFCRRRPSDLSIKQRKSNGIFQATLDDVDHALSSHSRSEHEVSDVMQCFWKCRDDSQCLSFNFEYTSILPTKKCELNGVTKGQDPKNYVKRPGYTYYDNAG